MSAFGSGELSANPQWWNLLPLNNKNISRIWKVSGTGNVTKFHPITNPSLPVPASIGLVKFLTWFRSSAAMSWHIVPLNCPCASKEEQLAELQSNKAQYVSPAIADVIGQNERRRQLTPGQKALVAEQMATLKQGEHKGNQYTRENGKTSAEVFPTSKQSSSKSASD
jgi:hypothetical protein